MADAAHWNERYETIGETDVSWFEPEPTVSLEVLDRMRVKPADSVIDVGGGASRLVDALLRRGHTDVTVLDVADTALSVARERVGEIVGVEWVATDLLTWHPDRRRRVWHDRAVLHFLVDDADRGAYLSVLRATLEPGGVFAIGVFAADGPETCSGLPVRRWTIEELGAWLVTEADADVVLSRRHVHHTPTGGAQPFSWVAGRLPSVAER